MLVDHVFMEVLQVLFTERGNVYLVIGPAVPGYSDVFLKRSIRRRITSYLPLRTSDMSLSSRNRSNTALKSFGGHKDCALFSSAFLSHSFVILPLLLSSVYLLRMIVRRALTFSLSFVTSSRGAVALVETVCVLSFHMS